MGIMVEVSKSCGECSCTDSFNKKRINVMYGYIDGIGSGYSYEILKFSKLIFHFPCLVFLPSSSE